MIEVESVNVVVDIVEECKIVCFLVDGEVFCEEDFFENFWYCFDLFLVNDVCCIFIVV